MCTASLGGNATTLMVACVSPADTNAQDSMSTLRFAQSATRVHNAPVVNRDTDAQKLLDARRECHALRRRVEELELLLAQQNDASNVPASHTIDATRSGLSFDI